MRALDIAFVTLLCIVGFWLLILTVDGSYIWDTIGYLWFFRGGMNIEEVKKAWGSPVEVLHPGEENSILSYTKKGRGIPIRYECYHYVLNDREEMLYLFVDENGTVYHMYWHRD